MAPERTKYCIDDINLKRLACLQEDVTAFMGMIAGKVGLSPSRVRAPMHRLGLT